MARPQQTHCTQLLPAKTQNINRIRQSVNITYIHSSGSTLQTLYNTVSLITGQHFMDSQVPCYIGLQCVSDSIRDFSTYGRQFVQKFVPCLSWRGGDAELLFPCKISRSSVTIQMSAVCRDGSMISHFFCPPSPYVFANT